MARLTVESPQGLHNIAYVIVHDSGGFWVIDEICTDAPAVKDGGGTGNRPPTVATDSECSGDEGSPITFDASGSSDPDSDTLSYAWNFGDGSPVSHEVSCTHTYVQDGTYSATLVVSDGTNSVTKDVTVTVANVAPAVTITSATTQFDEGSTIAVSGSFVDPGADSWSATVDYGDGTGVRSLALTGKTFALNHVYADDDTFTLTVTVRDGDGAIDTSTLALTVENVAPVVAITSADSSIDEGSTFAGSGSFVDPGADSWTATVDYGDGSGPQTLALTSDKSFTLSHAYTDDGGFTVTLIVNDGAADGRGSAVVKVVDGAPEVTASADDTSLVEGDTFTGTGSFNDPGADTWTATVDYGDGSGVQPLALTGTTFALEHVYADDDADDAYTVTVVVTDENDGSDSATVAVSVRNTAPDVTINADDTSLPEGGTFTGSGSFTDPGTEDTWTATVDYGDGSGVQPLALTGKTFALSHVYAEDGADDEYTLTVAVTDKDGGSDTSTLALTVENVAPVVAIASATTPIDEGSTFAGSGSFTDPEADTWTATVDYGDGSGVQPLALTGKTFALRHLYVDDDADDTYIVTVAVTDGDGVTGMSTLPVTVENAAPAVGAIAAPLSPVRVGTRFTASAPFTDPGALDTHTAAWTWGDGTAPGIVSETHGSGSVTGTHAYTTPGIYTVRLDVTDKDGAAGSPVSMDIVVYDPNDGFVIGVGWMDSPAGAYRADPNLAGRATFGFIARYPRNGTVPTGQLLLRFGQTDLVFRSTSYDSLVINGTRAQFTGTGQVNRAGTYGFRLAVIDVTDRSWNRSDLIRLKVWERSTGTVVYDNQMGAEDAAAPTTTIGGGSIVIHNR